MTNADVALLAVVALLLLTGVVLAVAETSLTRISRVKAMALADEGRRGAGTLTSLLLHPERFLNTILLVVLIVQTVQTSLATIVGVRLLGTARGSAAAIFFNVVVTFVLAEAAPKTWALQHTERAALATSPVVKVLVVFPPLALLTRLFIKLSNIITPGKGIPQGPFVSEEELLATLDVATEDEVIEHEERALIRSIIEFGDTVVREVMVPRPDMVAVEGRDKVSDVIEVAIAAGYSRIPVYDQGIDDVIGIVYTKDLMRAAAKQGAQPVRELARPAHFVPETKRVAELMREMQKQKFHIAIVVDEYGGTAGLVTLEDLIEELIGEIIDEFDVEEPTFEALPNGDGYRVNARTPIDEVNELLHAEFPEGDWDTIGGFLFNLLGHVPTEGESADYDGYCLAAEKVSGQRIGRVRIVKGGGDGEHDQPETAERP